VACSANVNPYTSHLLNNKKRAKRLSKTGGMIQTPHEGNSLFKPKNLSQITSQLNDFNDKIQIISVSEVALKNI
jgi:hypothetical protein